ncbi:Anti-sigma K factor RskA [Knoellia sinensis KCTC 19936]|uniref:Regulator of SigK n=1 Tax=Knoellia sinensis KCTC 19936 TaxID=1385520 RepID=A0A0A0JDX2_9MICO|nr:anti-sigma factor [Knoellia sinensis]KGN34257.1 Anti-sigma K factor RskA [Knoellia sinensis KCTC 19936]
MNPDTHALAGAYAVNAVTDEESRSFEAHLEVCADCRAEVTELRAAAAALAADVELPPPPALRNSVLSAIAQTRQLPPLPVTEPADPTAATAGSTGSRATAGTTDDLATRRRPRLRPWLAAAAAAAVLAVGTLIWSPWNDGPAQLTATEQVLQAPDAQRVEQPMNGSEIAIVRSPARGQAVFVADAMPAAPAGKAYQLWLDLPGRGLVSAGLIPASGAAVTVMLDGDAAAATGAGITLEPAAGSEAPTSDPVALFSFT